MNDHPEFKNTSCQQYCSHPILELALFDAHVIDDFIEDELEFAELGLAFEQLAHWLAVIFAHTVFVVVEFDLWIVLKLLSLKGFIDRIVAQIAVLTVVTRTVVAIFLLGGLTRLTFWLFVSFVRGIRTWSFDSLFYELLIGFLL